MSLRRASVLALSSVALALVGRAPALAQVPGGFLELATGLNVRPLLTPTEIQLLIPERGLFTFPPPYLTRAVRLTNSSDCGGTDCVIYVGYSYWRNMNNHVGSDTMLIFLTLDRARGGSGPTLFSYNKVTDALTKVGPLFDPASPFSWATGEGWYFSATRPTTLYVMAGPKLLRYDVIAKTFETVLDVSTQPALFGTNRFVWQTHSSNDDRVHSATLRDATTYRDLGCFAYREDTQQFFYFPQLGFEYDECQIDKSGRWLLIKEKLGTDPSSEVDNRIIDLTTGVETDLLDRNGAGGHSDDGFGYMVAADNRNVRPNAIRLWKFGSNPLAPGLVVYYDPQWIPPSIDHISHANAIAGVPPEQQYVCGSGSSALNGPRVNEIVCFLLDGSFRVLVVAPVMTDMNASGGGARYSKYPKGNLDVTGQYFMWTSNLEGSRLDAFIVKVPSQLLTDGIDRVPPTASMTAPISGTTVTGTVTTSATAADNVGVVGVQFQLDGGNLGAERTSAPYSFAWDTTTVANGAHTLTAVARDAAGNTATANPVTVTVNNPDLTPPAVAITSPTPGPTYTTSNPLLTLAGTASDIFGVTLVTWANNWGDIGTATGTTSWTASGIVLKLGTNVFTVTARDAAGNTGRASLTVTFVDTAPPAVAITSPSSGPTYATSSPLLTLAGTASDNVGVTLVTWANDRSSGGTAIGTATWTASGIMLLPGTNALTVTAQDATGNTATARLTVTLGTFEFTDDPLVAQGTPVRAAHIMELRAATDSVRMARGLTPFAWTDPTLTPEVTPVRVVHVTELRSALDEAYQAAGRTLPTYTDPAIVAGLTIIEAIDLNEVRAAVRALE